MPSPSVMFLFAVLSVALVLLDPLWVRLGRSYWRFTPMMARLRLSPRLRSKDGLEQLLSRLGSMWGCPIEWRRRDGSIEFHGKGMYQWLGCGRIVDPEGDGFLSVEIPVRQAYLLPIALANVVLVGPLGWPVAAGLLLSVFTAFIVQRMFARRLELAARFVVMKPGRRAALLQIVRSRVARRAR